ncbi:alpha/beta fold hydrolase [Halalkalibacillus halophilus]|uniref:alpha/beta fold hydrolase n=1 Tax=Halalkalibacillus halophilus TaxID=392827 RepID=UPI000427A28E|nr:alpha/beta hydrolase [Halalkalibacillus halophilus]
MLLDYRMYQHDTSNEWVVFLHGAGGNHTVFYKQAKKFKKHFNCLFINFPGHGKSESLTGKYTFSAVADKVTELLDHLKIHKFHMIGVSLGTIVMNELCRKVPGRIASMTMAGAVIKWKLWTDLLFKFAFLIRYSVPYMVLYTLFANILMPKRNHKQSRDVFVKEAKKIGQKEFLRWAELLIGSKSIHEDLMKEDNEVPKLYMMGEEDHVFMKGARHAVHHDPHANLYIVEDSGHVCNIDQAHEFNDKVISFVDDHASESQGISEKKAVSSA